MEKAKLEAPEPKFLKLTNIRKKKKPDNPPLLVPQEEIAHEVIKETAENEVIEPSFLQSLMADEERCKDTLIRLNDQAVQEIQSGNCNGGLILLERLKKILEYMAENGRLLDRNMIIVCLYNMASAYQMGWVLEKCAEYIDAVVFNLNQSIKQDEALIASSTAELNNLQVATLTSIKMRKQRFLLKIYLQYCAVLSQLSKHEEALDLAHKAQRTMISILSSCSSYCREAKEFLDRDSQSQVHQDGSGSRPSNIGSLGLSFDFYKNFDKSAMFYDEVPFLKYTLDFAIPFLNSFISTVKKFSVSKVEDTLKQTRKLLFNWKNNPENTEKYLRKEFGRANFLKDNEDRNRSILGLQTSPSWLQSLNIGSFMHMKPLKYREYAEKKELISELTKESLQEKVILQSLIYFSTATEIRFLRGEEGDKSAKDEAKLLESQQMSEAYHLTAIELVCRYINGICPYLNHLIGSYQKHYNQNLETIPEESFYSLSESVFSPTSRSDQKEDRLSPARLQHHYQEAAKEEKLSKKEKKLIDPIKMDQNTVRRSSDNILHILKNNKNRVKSTEKEEKLKEAEEPKASKEGRKNNLMKGVDVRTKKVLKEGDDAKKGHENNLSSSSLTFGSGISKTFSPSHNNTSSTKNMTMNTSKNDSLPSENNDLKHLGKKNHNIPNLGLNKIFKPNSLKESPKKSSGFHSDRPQQSTKTEDAHPKPRMSERKAPQKDSLQGGINFYLYKNFNKFIQNLYVKNAEQNKQKSRRSGRDNLMDNPYVKEIVAASSARKASHHKSSHSPPNLKSSNINYGKQVSNTEPEEIIDLGSENLIGFSSASPKKRGDNYPKVSDFTKKKMDQVDKILYKSKSARAAKISQHVDLIKGDGQKKPKAK